MPLPQLKHPGHGGLEVFLRRTVARERWQSKQKACKYLRQGRRVGGSVEFALRDAAPDTGENAVPSARTGRGERICYRRVIGGTELITPSATMQPVGWPASHCMRAERRSANARAAHGASCVSRRHSVTVP